jgi:hypothetical protein
MNNMMKMMDEDIDEKGDPDEMKKAMESVQSMVQSNPKLVENMLSGMGGLGSGKLPDMSKLMNVNMESLMRNKDFKKLSKEMKSKLKK